MGKQSIPRALREQVWMHYMGNAFSGKCMVPWCKNRISCFQFHVGHNVPESKGGGLNIGNLRPICDRCNASMGNSYTIDEWSKAFEDKGANSKKICCCTVM